MKYLFYGSVSFLTALAAAGSAYALDGGVVDGGSTSPSFVIDITLLLFLIFAVGVVTLVFWAMMMVHAIKNPIANKTLWIIFLFFFGQPAALIYYFAVKKDFHSLPPPAGAPPIQ